MPVGAVPVLQACPDSLDARQAGEGRPDEISHDSGIPLDALQRDTQPVLLGQHLDRLRPLRRRLRATRLCRLQHRRWQRPHHPLAEPVPAGVDGSAAGGRQGEKSGKSLGTCGGSSPVLRTV
ncbi:unnamed protein product [Ectocarpus sp. 13 AM-2016]